MRASFEVLLAGTSRACSSMSTSGATSSDTADEPRSESSECASLRPITTKNTTFSWESRLEWIIFQHDWKRGPARSQSKAGPIDLTCRGGSDLGSQFHLCASRARE